MPVKILAALAIAMPCACGPDGGGDDDDDTSADAGEDAAPGDDGGTDAGTSCSGTFVEEVTGALLETGGAVLADATVGLCLRSEQSRRETFVCLRPVAPDDEGLWTVAVPVALRCVKHAVVRLAAAGHATSYCEIDVEGAAPRLEAPTWDLVPMPPDPPAWGAGDEPIALAAEDGATVTIRPSDVAEDQDPEAVRFRVVDPAEHRPCFLPADQTPLALYVLEPESNVVPAEGLSAIFRDGTAAAPGTPVSLYLLGGLHTVLGGEIVQEGAWVPFADAEVDPDGAIATPAGVGLPQLGWYGVLPR